MGLQAKPLQLSTLDAGFDAAFAQRLHWSADTDAAIEQRVADILADVRQRGDAAVLEYTARFDQVPAQAMAEQGFLPLPTEWWHFDDPDSARYPLTDIGFEAKHLFAILAHLAVHHRRTFKDLLDPILEGIEDQRVVIQIARLDELDLRETRGHLVGIAVDALNQNAGEEEVGEDDDALVAELGGVRQARLDQRESHARIAGFAPAEAHAFPEHAHDLAGIGIGIRIGRTATDNHQQRLVFVDKTERLVRLVDRRLDAVAGGTDHLEINAELATVIDHEILVLRLIGVEHQIGRASCRERVSSPV